MNSPLQATGKKGKPNIKIRTTCTFTLLLMAVTALAWGNLVKNGKFEVGAKLEGWKEGSPQYQFADDDGFREPGCLRFAGPATERSEGPRQEVAVRPNTEYVLVAATKSDGQTHPFVRLRRVDGTDTVVAVSGGKSQGWRLVSQRFNSGKNERLILSCLGNEGAVAEGAKAWFDDIAVLLPEEVPAGLSVQGGLLRKPPGENVARGGKVTFNVPPNYGYSLDDGDATQLTDGEYSAGYFWVQKSTVGWAHVPSVQTTIDLGKVQPISGASFNTAAGCAGVAWPATVLVLTSEDGSAWRCAGDLVVLSAKNGLPAADQYSVYRYFSGDLTTRGRYVRIVTVAPNGFTFCDEIEVYRGPDDLLAGEPGGEVVSDLKEYLKGVAPRSGILWRMMTDLGTAKSAMESSKLPEAKKKELYTRLDAAEKGIASLPPPDLDTFKAIVPLNDAHARILSVFAPVLRARGFPAFFAWKKNRYDPLGHTELPEAAPASVSLSIEMMRNEFRADAFLLTNATEQPTTAALRVEGLPGAPRPAWLSVSAVPWTDTSQKVPVAAALPDAEFSGGAYRIPIPAGMTRKVWITVDSSSLKSGTHDGKLVIAGGGTRLTTPFHLRVSHLKMGRPRLSIGMWDYTNGNGAYGITPRNRDSAIEVMRSHFLDSPWAGPGALPLPAPEFFDAKHQLVRPLDFTEFDEWVRRWPGARHYLVFVNVLETWSFAGTRRGTPEFNARVGAWAKALSAHVTELGLKPQQLGLLLVDEPSTDECDEAIVAWGKPIKAAAPELTIFEDTAWERPDQAKIQEAVTIADILCPYLGRWHTGGKAAQDYYQQRRAEGRRLWFYQASGPAKLLDPYRYHRLQAWECFRYGATGTGYWAFGDPGGAKSSWNEYTATGTPYSPAFLDDDKVTTGVHWEAVREGVEDYETLAMLRDAAAKTQDAALKAEAESLLAEAPEKVVGGWNPDIYWAREVDRSVADRYRLQALTLLEKMR